MGFNNIWIKPLINPWHINHHRKEWQGKTFSFSIIWINKNKILSGSKILRLMQFPITYLILIKEIIKHLLPFHKASLTTFIKNHPALWLS